MQLFSDWAREAYWLLTDVQRERGLIASVTKKALQVILGKPTRGVPACRHTEGITQSERRPRGKATRQGEAQST